MALPVPGSVVSLAVPDDPAFVSDRVPEQLLSSSAQDTVVEGQEHGFVPTFRRLVAQSPLLQHRAQILSWVKETPEQTVEGEGDQIPPQGTIPTGQQGADVLVPVFSRLVAQSPSLQHRAQVLVWVKETPEQTVEGEGDQVSPQENVPAGQQGADVLVPVLHRLVEQSPVLQPALQVLVCVKD